MNLRSVSITLALWLAFPLLFIRPPVSVAGTRAEIHRPRTDVLLDAPIKGNLIIYRVGYTQCSIFFSDEGMAKGTVAPNCVLLPFHLVPEGGHPFEVLDVVGTTDE